jgi:hypothetical protein
MEFDLIKGAEAELERRSKQVRHDLLMVMAALSEIEDEIRQ